MTKSITNLGNDGRTGLFTSRRNRVEHAAVVAPHIPGYAPTVSDQVRSSVQLINPPAMESLNWRFRSLSRWGSKARADPLTQTAIIFQRSGTPGKCKTRKIRSFETQNPRSRDHSDGRRAGYGCETGRNRSITSRGPKEQSSPRKSPPNDNWPIAHDQRVLANRPI